MLSPERHTYRTSQGQIIDHGIEQLWALPQAIQEEVLSQAMQRWDQVMPNSESLHQLKIDYQAAYAVKPANLYPTSLMNKRDILSAIFMGNLEIYPWISLGERDPDGCGGISRDAMDCGTWDGVDGKSGYYFEQNDNLTIGVINPANRKHLHDLWGEPQKIRRVAEWRKKIRNEEMFIKTKDQDGMIILKPGRSYIIGIYPAIRLNCLNIRLRTRSGSARWNINGMVNADTVHDRHNGILAAEAIVFSNDMTNLSTAWKPWQMVFEYIQSVPDEIVNDREDSGIHKGDYTKTLKEVIKDFTPAQMLPKPIESERRIVISE